MKSLFHHAALVGKYQAVSSGSGGALSRQTLHRIGEFLMGLGLEVSLEAYTATNMNLNDYSRLNVAGIGKNCDVCIVVGGDGTMLGIARQLARYGVPLIGINQGRLGFMTDIPLLNFETILRPMLEGHFTEERRSLIQARVWRDGHCFFSAEAMNDVVVNRGGTAGMVELRVEVDGHFVANQRADGLIISTPTGATAYSLSAGGPLMHPSIPGWVLVPIAPHTLSNRPIVLANTSEVAIEIIAGRDASANFDMQSLASLWHGDRIVVTRSEHEARFLHPEGWSYFDTLRQKLYWNAE